MPQNSDPNLITFDIAVLKGYIKNSHDIVTFRDELLLGGFSTEMLIYLAEIVDQDFASKTPRLNKRVIFQVFRNLIKIGGSVYGADATKSRELALLFFAWFRRFHRSSTYSDAVNRLLIHQELNEEQIQWLIDHCEDELPAFATNHALNRLLKYQYDSTLIYEWAKQCLAQGRFEDRSWDLYAILISTDGNYTAVPSTEHRALLGAIYRSRLGTERKRQLYFEVADRSDIRQLVLFAVHSGDEEIIKRIKTDLLGGV